MSVVKERFVRKQGASRKAIFQALGQPRPATGPTPSLSATRRFAGSCLKSFVEADLPIDVLTGTNRNGRLVRRARRSTGPRLLRWLQASSGEAEAGHRRSRVYRCRARTDESTGDIHQPDPQRTARSP